MTTKIAPQPGFQRKFLSSNQDIVIGGGACAAGKSFALMLEALRHTDKKSHNGVIFRRTCPQLRSLGSIYQESKLLYPNLGAKLNDSRMEYVFSNGARINFSHMQSESHMFSHQGSQYSFIGWDELCQFTNSQFLYLISRLRNKDISPYIRATCNPDADSFVKKLVSPFLDDAGQYPDLSKCGSTLYVGWDEHNNPVFNREKKETSPLSITFIPGTLEDNKILLNEDPNYQDKLKSLPLVERSRLLLSDWSITYSSGNVFKRDWFLPCTTFPSGRAILAFDLASTIATQKNKDPDYSAACLMVRNGYNYYIVRVWRDRLSPAEVYKWIKRVETESKLMCQSKGCFLKAVVEEEGGSAAKRENETLKNIFTVPVSFVRPSTNKVMRSRGLSAAAEQGNVFALTSGINNAWIEEFLNECQAFPEGKHDDMVDAAAYAFSDLSSSVF